MTIVRVADFTFEVPEADRMLQFEMSGFGVIAGNRRIVIDPWLAFDEKREVVRRPLGGAGLELRPLAVHLRVEITDALCEGSQKLV